MALKYVAVQSGEQSLANPTWWDIKKAVNDDTHDYEYKVCILLTNDHDDITITSQIYTSCSIKTSDGVYYEKNTPTETITHTFDTTQDKPCYENDIEIYKTRWVMLLSDNVIEISGSKIYSYTAGSGKGLDALYIYGNKENSFTIYGSNYYMIVLELLENMVTPITRTSGFLTFSRKFKALNNSNVISYDLSSDTSLYQQFTTSSFQIMNGTFELKINENVTDLQLTFPDASRSTFLFKKIKLLSNTSNCKYVFGNYGTNLNGFSNLEEIEGEIDLINCTTTINIANCYTLRKFNFKNIHKIMVLANTNSGQYLDYDCVFSAMQECIKQSSQLNFAVGYKIYNWSSTVYVKFTDPTQTTIEEGQKGVIELCESTDTGAMTLVEYMALKNWNVVVNN